MSDTMLIIKGILSMLSIILVPGFCMFITCLIMTVLEKKHFKNKNKFQNNIYPNITYNSIFTFDDVDYDTKNKED